MILKKRKQFFDEEPSSICFRYEIPICYPQKTVAKTQKFVKVVEESVGLLQNKVKTLFLTQEITLIKNTFFNYEIRI